jgi:hypothetical protein
MHRKEFIKTLSLSTAAISMGTRLCAMAAKPNTYDVAIIGAGITGLATALYLQQHSALNLCIIDPKPIASADLQQALATKLHTKCIQRLNTYKAIYDTTYGDAQLQRFVQFIQAYRRANQASLQSKFAKLPDNAAPYTLQGISTYQFLLQNNYHSAVVHSFVQQHLQAAFQCPYQNISAWHMLHYFALRCTHRSIQDMPALPCAWQPRTYTPIICYQAHVQSLANKRVLLHNHSKATISATQIIVATNANDARHCANANDDYKLALIATSKYLYGKQTMPALAKGISLAHADYTGLPYIEEALAAAAQIARATQQQFT